MNFRKALWKVGGGVAFAGLIGAAALLASLHASQPSGFRVYRSMEPYDDVALPPDYQDKTEWVFARLMYPEHPNALFSSRRFRFNGSLLARGRHQLDAGLSTRGPSLRAGAASADAA